MKLDLNDLKFTRKAIYRVDKEKDVKVADFFDEREQLSIALIYDLLWAGFLDKHPNVTVDDVLEQVDIFGNKEKAIESVTDALMEAFGGDFDIPEEPEKN